MNLLEQIGILAEAHASSQGQMKVALAQGWIALVLRPHAENYDYAYLV